MAHGGVGYSRVEVCDSTDYANARVLSEMVHGKFRCGLRTGEPRRLLRTDILAWGAVGVRHDGGGRMSGSEV